MDSIIIDRRPVNPTQLKRNAEARKSARKLLDMANELVGPEVSEERFWEILAEEAASRIGKVVADENPALLPMTDKEAAEFELTEFPYGAFKGDVIIEIPVTYFLSITESPYHRKLMRYLKSKAFARRQEDLD